MSTAFRISLDGAQQVPGVVTTASGLGTAIFDSASSSLSITIILRGLDFGPLLGQAPQTTSISDDVTGAYVFNGPRGANGPVVFSLQGDVSQTLTSYWETTDSANFTATFATATVGVDVPFYVSIPTVANGSGEIRGQFVCIATDDGETVNGTGSSDFLPGLGGDDVLVGGAGADALDGGTGADIMVGGLDDDIYLVDNASDAVVEDPGEGNDTVFSAVHFRLPENAENLILLDGSDLQGYGNRSANAL